MIGHHTSNGCNLEIGGVIGSGTVCGPEKSSWGSLLELTRARAPIRSCSGSAGTQLHWNGKGFIFAAFAQGPATRASASADAAR